MSTKSSKSEECFVPCHRSDCFAYGHTTGCCQVLTDNNFHGRACPFFKTKQKYQDDRVKAEERVSSLTGVREYNVY